MYIATGKDIAPTHGMFRPAAEAIAAYNEAHPRTTGERPMTTAEAKRAAKRVLEAERIFQDDAWDVFASADRNVADARRQLLQAKIRRARAKLTYKDAVADTAKAVESYNTKAAA
jgi:hypothetical protein